jgi:hypothetical protein
MVSIVEEQPIPAHPRPMFADTPHQGVVIPLVYEHQVRPIQCLMELKCLQIVACARQPGIHRMEPLDGPFSLLCDEMLQAPGLRGLIDAQVVSTPEQFRGYTAQEMGIAVIPVRQQ